MKAILHIGAILMVGASIYGFIDYKRSSNEKQFRTLYDNKEEVAMRKKEKELSSARGNSATLHAETSTAAAIPEVTTKKINVRKKKTINYKEFSRARIDEKISKEELKAKATKGSGKIETKEQ